MVTVHTCWVTQASGFPTVSSSVTCSDPTPPPPSDCCIHHRRSSTDGAHWRQQDLGGSEGPWWVGVEVGVGGSPPRPCSTLTLQVPVSCGPRCQQKELGISQVPGKELFSQSRDQLPIGVGGVLSLSRDSCHEGPLMGPLSWLARKSPEKGLRDGLWV